LLSFQVNLFISPSRGFSSPSVVRLVVERVLKMLAEVAAKSKFLLDRIENHKPAGMADINTAEDGCGEQS
jgi:hypothetical protein